MTLIFLVLYLPSFSCTKLLCLKAGDHCREESHARKKAACRRGKQAKLSLSASYTNGDSLTSESIFGRARSSNRSDPPSLLQTCVTNPQHQFSMGQQGLLWEGEQEKRSASANLFSSQSVRSNLLGLPDALRFCLLEACLLALFTIFNSSLDTE